MTKQLKIIDRQTFPSMPVKSSVLYGVQTIPHRTALSCQKNVGKTEVVKSWDNMIKRWPERYSDLPKTLFQVIVRCYMQRNGAILQEITVSEVVV